MFRSVTPPIPDSDHIDQMDKLIRKQNDTMVTISSDIQDYFSKAIFQIAKSSPKELTPIYDGFIKSGVKFANSFVAFMKKLSPTLGTVTDLQSKYEHLSRIFAQYQDSIKAVRDEETPENIEKEKKDLLKFAEEFKQFNSDSNVFLPCFLALYISCCTQLSADSAAFVKELIALIDGFKPIEKTKEEIKIEELIQKLEVEVKQFNEKAAQKPGEHAQAAHKPKKQVKLKEQQKPKQQQNKAKEEKEEPKEKQKQEKEEEQEVEKP